MTKTKVIEHIDESDGVIVVLRVVVTERNFGGDQNWQNVQSFVDSSTLKLRTKIWRKYMEKSNDEE